MIKIMNLREFLKSHGITQKELADQVGCTPGAISHFCTKRRGTPRRELARKIVKATRGQVSYADLYAEVEA